jgi:anaerobic selenocysteine-containing dehydrogenase
VAIREALGNVPNVIAFGAIHDDTMDFADLILPEETFLESWGTEIPEPGPGYQVVGTQQPVVGPTISRDESGLTSDARGFGDTLLAMSDGSYGRDMESLVRGALSDLHSTGRGSVSASTSSLFTNGALQRGGWWDTNNNGSSSVGKIATSAQSANYSETGSLGEGNDFHLVPFLSNSLLDGRLAAAPWAQQTPDPISSASWSTWGEINSIQADELGIKEGDVLLIRSTSGEIEVLAYPHPGVRPGVIGIPMGQGHLRSGRYAEERGSNVLSILVDEKDSQTGALAWAATRVRIQRAGKRVKVPKFEGDVVARPVEPGVPVLVVGIGETASDVQTANHHLYQEQFLGEGKESGDHE